MQMQTACATVGQSCRPQVFKSASGLVAGRKSLTPAFSNSPPRLRPADSAIHSSSNATLVICSSGCTGSACGAMEGGRSTRAKIDAVTSCWAALQEGGVSIVEQAASENGASRLTDQSSDVHHHARDYIGFGCVLENDGSFFRERFVIRFSEAGHRGTVSLETLSSLLQEAATNHVIAMDYPFMPGKNLGGHITVTTRMHIEVDRYPAWRDLLEIDTWFQREGKNAVRRDWVVKDVKTGQNITFATSTWVLMNTLTRRLSKISEEQWQELNPHMRHPPRFALSEDRREASSTKILKLGDNVTYKKSGLIASDKDTDMNQHVNNIRYIGWMLECIPEEVRIANEVSKITLEYRQEANRGEVVESLAEVEEVESNTGWQFIHLITSSAVGKEINRGRTVWRRQQ